MSQNLPLNPYFDPNPHWYFHSLHGICIVSIVVYVQAVYVISQHSPRYISKSYKHLLIGHLTTATVFQLNVTIICPILPYLPFVAGEGIGLMAYFDIGINHQIVLLFTSILAAITIIVPLFYYRLSCILPESHFLNRKSSKYSLYSFAYVASYILPPPFIYLSIHHDDLNEVKKSCEMTYNMTFPNLYSTQVVAIIVGTNPWAIVCAAGVFGACLIQGTVIFGSSYLSYKTLKKTSSSFSTVATKHHINVLKSLVAMIVSIGTVVVVILPAIACLYIFNSTRSDVANLLILCGSTTIPIAIISYIIIYKPYREHYLRKINCYLKIKPKYRVTPHISIIQ